MGEQSAPEPGQAKSWSLPMRAPKTAMNSHRAGFAKSFPPQLAAMLQMMQQKALLPRR
jgi:hypothetical protein